MPGPLPDVDVRNVGVPVPGVKMVPVVEICCVAMMIDAKVHACERRKPGVLGSHRLVRISQQRRRTVVVGCEKVDVMGSERISVVGVPGDERMISCDEAAGSRSVVTGQGRLGGVTRSEPVRVAVVRVVAEASPSFPLLSVGCVSPPLLGGGG